MMESNQPEGRKCRKCEIISISTRRSNSEANKDREYYYCPSDNCKNAAGFYNFLGWADQPEQDNKPFKKRKSVTTQPVNNVACQSEVVNIVNDIQSIIKKMQTDNNENWKDVVSILHEQTVAIKEMEPVIKKAIDALERLSK